MTGPPNRIRNADTSPKWCYRAEHRGSDAPPGLFAPYWKKKATAGPTRCRTAAMENTTAPKTISGPGEQWARRQPRWQALLWRRSGGGSPSARPVKGDATGRRVGAGYCLGRPTAEGRGLVADLPRFPRRCSAIRRPRQGVPASPTTLRLDHCGSSAARSSGHRTRTATDFRTGHPLALDGDRSDLPGGEAGAFYWSMGFR